MSRSPKFQNLILNPKYRKLKPPLSIDDLQNLEAAVREHRIQTPIISWKRTILDGYKRYDIAKSFGVRLRVKGIHFEYEEEAICWICKHELERENLTESFKKYLIGTYYHAKRDLLAKKYPMKTISPHFESGRPPIEFLGKTKNYTAAVVCNELGVTAGSLSNYKSYAGDIDRIRTKSEQVVDMILLEQVVVSQAAVSLLASLSLDNFEKVQEFIITAHPQHLKQNDINDLIVNGEFPMKRIIKERSLEPAIKFVPAYDPDAELSSLTLTIPSWISSMARTLHASSLEEATPEAKEKLNLQLWELQKAILRTQLKIMENHDD